MDLDIKISNSPICIHMQIPEKAYKQRKQYLKFTELSDWIKMREEGKRRTQTISEREAYKERQKEKWRQIHVEEAGRGI
jgi:hypothetical protein